MTDPGYTPVPRRSQKLRARVIGSLVLVAVAGGLMYVVVGLASRNPDQANLPGGDTFVVGDAERFASRIAEQRAPIFFKDPLTAGAGREIYVLHQGNDPEEGWSAVLAYVDAENRRLECVLQWRPREGDFRDPCSGETYEPDDGALTRYEVDMRDDGKVEVDLRSGRTAP